MPRNQPPSQPSNVDPGGIPGDLPADLDPADREPPSIPRIRDPAYDEALTDDDIMEVLDLDDLQQMDGPDA